MSIPVMENIYTIYDLYLFICDFAKTIPNHTAISWNTNLKYLNHCGSLMLECSHAGFTVEVQ